MRNVLTCTLLFVGIVGCDTDGSTSAPSSVPPVDMAAAVAPPSGADMATTTPTPTFPTTASVSVGPNNSLSYAPATVDIAAGGTVTWTWAGTLPHTVTSADNPPAFPSSPVQTSGTFQATFPNAGTFRYFCQVHGINVMSGTVNVH